MTPQGPTWEYLHIVAAPFAVVLAVTGALVGVSGWIAGREQLERWGLVALLLAAVTAVPAYSTGLTAADVAAARTFVEPSLVQTHRTWATWTAVASVSVGVFAAFSLLQPGDARLRRFVLVSGLAAAALAGWTAFLGGKIVHGPEADRERIEEEIGRGAGGACPRRRGTIRSATPTVFPTDRSIPMARSSPASRRGPFHPPAPANGPDAGRFHPTRALPAVATALLGAAAAFVGPSPAAAQQPDAAPEPTLGERARAIHEEALVWDGHNDLPWRIRNEADLDLDAMGLDGRLEEGHTDLVRLREGGIDAQFWSVYVPAEAGGDDATEMVLEQIDLVKRMADRYPGHLEMAYSADDVVRIASSGRTASLLGAEGGHAIANSLPVLRELCRAGVRYMTLTHSGTLAWADAVGDSARHGGLSDFGRRVVREMNRLGMLVDLSHVTDDVMHDALEVSEAPVIFSHSSARAVADHDRNVPDDVLREVAENGGVVMITFVSGYLTPEGAEIMDELFRVQRRLRKEHPDPAAYEEAYRRWREENPVPPGDVATVADHVDHVVDVAGVDHVGVGSDWDGTSTLPAGLEDVSKLPNLTEELLRRGYSEVEVEKILGGNVLRAMRDVEETAARLEGETPPVDRLPQRGAVGGGETDGGGGR